MLVFYDPWRLPRDEGFFLQLPRDDDTACTGGPHDPMLPKVTILTTPRVTVPTRAVRFLQRAGAGRRHVRGQSERAQLQREHPSIEVQRTRQQCRSTEFSFRKLFTVGACLFRQAHGRSGDGALLIGGLGLLILQPYLLLGYLRG
jgi:hypothetical protein